MNAINLIEQLSVIQDPRQVWKVDHNVVLGQAKTSEKSNEITAIPELLQLLELKGCLVTIDAL